MSNEALADALVPLAAELAATVRDFGPEDVAAVLARVPDGRHDALAVVLAAMVDPDARPSELLAWTHSGLEYHRLIAAGVSHSVASTLVAEQAA
jgi:hypothetical protein